MKQRIFPAILFVSGVGLVIGAFHPDLLPTSAALMFLFGLPMAIVGLFRLIFTKTAKKIFHISTTLSSIALSLIVGFLLYTMFVLMIFDGPPLSEEPFWKSAFLICFTLFWASLPGYAIFRCRKLSALGFVLDGARAFLFLPGSFMVAGWMLGLICDWVPKTQVDTIGWLDFWML